LKEGEEMEEKSITEYMVNSVENAIIRKAESLNEMTSSEEIFALAELVRAISVCKKVNKHMD